MPVQDRRILSTNREAPDEFGNEVDSYQHPGVPKVRQLKPPPEIWELVQPVGAKQFKQRKSFATPSTSSWVNLLVLAVVVAALSGIGTAAWKYKNGQRFVWPSIAKETQVKPALKVEKRETPPQQTQPAPVSLTPAPSAEPSEATINADLLQTSLMTARAGKHIFKHQVPAEQKPTNAAGASGDRVSLTAGGSDQRSTAERSTNNDATRTSSDNSGTKSKPALSPQLIAPLHPVQTTKPKVIQWP